MAKYIDADALIRKFRDEASPLDIISKGYMGANVLPIGKINRIVEGMPAADVEPVRKWISVDERLPEEFRDVLVWYEYNGLYQTCGVGYRSDGTWVGKFNGKNQKAIAWMYFPEPPKIDKAKQN